MYMESNYLHINLGNAFQESLPHKIVKLFKNQIIIFSEYKMLIFSKMSSNSFFVKYFENSKNLSYILNKSQNPRQNLDLLYDSANDKSKLKDIY